MSGMIALRGRMSRLTVAAVLAAIAVFAGAASCGDGGGEHRKWPGRGDPFPRFSEVSR